MNLPTVIVVTGPPGAGKTTLGRMIADELGLAFINKDDIKESLFDSLGASDREWSRKLGAASYDLLYHFARTILKRRHSIVLESNFRLRDAPQLLELVRWGRCTSFQVYCTAKKEVLLERYKRRAESNSRHPGHTDHLVLPELEESLNKGEYGILNIGGQSVTVDTTDFGKVDVNYIIQKIREFWQD
jgi:predicted kinase